MFAFPNDNQRLAIVGSTGSGKTRCGIWHLSYRSWDVMPWIIFDFKGDDMIAKLEKAKFAKEVQITQKPPQRPGLYIVRPVLRTDSDKDVVNDYLWQLWKQGETGIYVDEGYMLGNSAAYQQIQTQGRSLKVPTITLSQRPRRMNVFVFSEADFIQVFRLNYPEDRKTAKGFVNFNLDLTLPPFYSVYYSVPKDTTDILMPVPSDEKIMEIFKVRAKPRLVFV